MNRPNFTTWDRINLENIALEMHIKLQRQQDEIEQLKSDFKCALNAYRQLNIEKG